MSDNTKGAGQTDAPADGPCENPSVSLGHGADTIWESSNRVFASGEWHERYDNWRDGVDLATCDNLIAYAAGRLDGHRHAMAEFYEMWKLLRPFYDFVGPKAARE